MPVPPNGRVNIARMPDPEQPKVESPLYHPFSRLCKITVLGKPAEVPERNMLLRGF